MSPEKDQDWETEAEEYAEDLKDSEREYEDDEEWEEDYQDEEWEEDYAAKPLSLKEQAAQLRAEDLERTRAGGSSSWAKVFYLLAVFAALFGSVYLLVFQETRRDLVRMASQRTGAWFMGDGEPTVHRLQAPPPRRTERILEMGPPPVVTGSPSEVLYYNTDPEGPAEEIEDPTRPAPPEPAQKTEGSIAAFNLLREKSEVAAQLVAGELEGLRYLDWKPVRNAPPEFYLELMVEGGEGALVWRVDLEAETVRALSFHATQLVARHRRGDP